MGAPSSQRPRHHQTWRPSAAPGSQLRVGAWQRRAWRRTRKCPRIPAPPLQQLRCDARVPGGELPCAAPRAASLL
eukprot:1757027-Prymnesium_polylepis.1